MSKFLKKTITVMLSLAMISTLGSCSEKKSHNLKKNTDLIALSNCTIIDGTGSNPTQNGVILINGDKIIKIGTLNTTHIPKGYKVINLNGKFVLPGFIIAHVHNAYNEDNLKNWLKAGVTTVRDCGLLGDDIDFIKERDTFNKRSDVTRIISASPNLGVNGGYGKIFYSSSAEAKKLVNEYADKNVDLIKFSIEDFQMNHHFNMPTFNELKSIVDTAHARGKKVAVHLTHEKFLDWAVTLGVDDIAHMVVEPINTEICDKIIKKNIYWIPTLELWAGVSKMYHLNWEDVAIKNLSMFYKAGGKIALGTDYEGYTCTFDKGFPITEVRAMKKAGMSNMDIIIAGTKNAAAVCGMDKKIGTLEPGKIADVLVLKDNPLYDIDNFKNTYMVIHNGQIVH